MPLKVVRNSIMAERPKKIKIVYYCEKSFSIVMHKERNYVRKVILTHETQFLKKSDFLPDKLLRPTLRYTFSNVHVIKILIT